MARRDFTESEDELLIEFLARHNPSGTGRNGNLIYEHLTDDVEGRWPWAATHPWRSWRNRYVKDSEWFDAKIRKYQKKNTVDLKGKDVYFTSQQKKGTKGTKIRTTGLNKPKVAGRNKDKDDSSVREPSGGEEENEPQPAESNAEGVRKRKRDSDESASKRQKIKRTAEGSEEIVEVTGPPTRTADDSNNNKVTDSKEVPSHTASGAFPDHPHVERLETARSDDGSESAHDDGEEVDELKSVSEGGDDSLQPLLNGDSTADGNSGATEGIPPISEATAPSEPPASPKLLYPDVTSLPPPRLSAAVSRVDPEDLSLLGSLEAGDVSIQDGNSTSRPNSDRMLQEQHQPSPLESTNNDHPPSPPLSQGGSQPTSTAQTLSIPPHAAPTRTDTLEISQISDLVQPKKSTWDKRKRTSGIGGFHAATGSDYFASPPDTPRSTGQSPLPVARQNRQLPRLVEGPFSISFAGSTPTRGIGRDDSETDGEDAEDNEQLQGTKKTTKEWPPQRSQPGLAGDKHRKDDSSSKKIVAYSSQSGDKWDTRRGRASGGTEVTSTQMIHPPLPSTYTVLADLKERQQQHPFNKQHPLTKDLLTRVAHHGSASAPSSERSVYHHPFSQPSQLPSRDETPGADFHDNSPNRLFPRSGVASRLFQPRHHVASNTPAAMSSKVVRHAVSRPDITRGTKTSPEHSSNVVFDKSLPSKTGGTKATSGLSKGAGPTMLTRGAVSHGNNATRYQTLPGSSAGSSSDPFVDGPAQHIVRESEVKARTDLTRLFDDKNRRQTFGGFPTDSSVPRVDLPVTNRSSRRSLPASRRIMTPIDDYLRKGIGMSPSNFIPSTAEASPVTLSAADKKLIYGEGLNSLIKRMAHNHGFQEDVTWRMWRAMGNLHELDLALKRMRDAAERAALDSVEMTDRPHGHTEMPGSHDHGYDSSSSSWASSQIRRHRHSASNPTVKFTPVAGEYGYSPPQASRAGQFSRLARQGRVKEALRREGRRASHGGTSPHKPLQKIRLPETLPTAGGRSQGSESRTESVPSHDNALQNGDAKNAWGKEDDEALRSGDITKLEELEKQKGMYSVRRRTVELLTSFLHQ